MRIKNPENNLVSGQAESNLEMNRQRLMNHIGEHIFDTVPHFEGDKKDLQSMGDARAGAFRAEVGRTDPPLQIERALFQSGKSYVVIGKNGAGKSTLMRTIATLQDADSGEWVK